MGRRGDQRPETGDLKPDIVRLRAMCLRRDKEVGPVKYAVHFTGCRLKTYKLKTAALGATDPQTGWGNLRLQTTIGRVGSGG